MQKCVAMFGCSTGSRVRKVLRGSEGGDYVLYVSAPCGTEVRAC